jgi:hypothetical protein
MAVNAVRSQPARERSWDTPGIAGLLLIEGGGAVKHDSEVVLDALLSRESQ